MIPYWLVFGYFMSGAFLNRLSRTVRQPSLQPLLIGTLVLFVFIGLRYEVGADWQSYEKVFALADYQSFGAALKLGDPGYQAVNWTVQQLGLGLWAVNLICAAIFSWGLLRFARVQADPWLALVVAVPYLVIVVAMGYTRQGVAIAIIMAGLASLERGGSMVKFAVYTTFALLFHRTAVVVFPLVVLSVERNRYLNVLLGIATTILLYDVFLASSMDELVKNYVRAGQSSQGAAVRVVMNLVPATLFLAIPNRFHYPPRDRKMWQNFSLAAWLFMALLLVSPSSTTVDRLALYVIPLQLAVLSRLPFAFNNSESVRLAVIVYSGLVLFVWMNFAIHAKYWLPYQFYPFA